MMNKTKDQLRAASANHARMLSIMLDQAERESVMPTDGTQIAAAVYALTLQVAELADATWATRQTLALMLERMPRTKAQNESEGASG